MSMTGGMHVRSINVIEALIHDNIHLVHRLCKYSIRPEDTLNIFYFNELYYLHQSQEMMRNDVRFCGLSGGAIQRNPNLNYEHFP